MISRRSKFNLLNEIVFCPRLLLFDPRGLRGAREGRGGERHREAQVLYAMGGGGSGLGHRRSCCLAWVSHLGRLGSQSQA